MTDVNASDIIPFRIFWFTVYGLPSEAIWTYKEIVKKANICNSDNDYSNPYICSIPLKNGFNFFWFSAFSRGKKRTAIEYCLLHQVI